MMYQQVLIFIKPEEPAALPLVKKIHTMISKNYPAIDIFTILSEKGFFKDSPKTDYIKTIDSKHIAERPTLAIVLGGDGTFLAANRYLYKHNAYITGVNLGRLGFLTEVEAEDLETHLLDVCKENVQIDSRPYFTAHVERNGEIILNPRPFINDAVLQRNSDEKMVFFDMAINGSFVTSARSDGLIVSTPTGSTAYNLSAGGPIVHPEQNALVVTPICPHTLSFRPAIVPAAEVRLTVTSNLAHLSLDGRQNQTLDEGDTVVVRPTEHKLNILHTGERNFYSLLRQKLRWVDAECP